MVRVTSVIPEVFSFNKMNTNFKRKHPKYYTWPSLLWLSAEYFGRLQSARESEKNETAHL